LFCSTKPSCRKLEILISSISCKRRSAKCKTRPGRAPEYKKGGYAMRTLINSLMIAASFVLVATNATAQTIPAPATSGPIYVLPAPQAGQIVGCCTPQQPVVVQQQPCCFGQAVPTPSFDQEVEELVKREAALNKLRDAAPSAQIPWMGMLPWALFAGLIIVWATRQFPVRTVSLRAVPVTVGPIPTVRPAAGRFCGHCGHGPAPAAANNCSACGTTL
jgi:hypothetical protein